MALLPATFESDYHLRMRRMLVAGSLDTAQRSLRRSYDHGPRNILDDLQLHPALWSLITTGSLGERDVSNIVDSLSER